jgi:hypothetical protein
MVCTSSSAMRRDYPFTLALRIALSLRVIFSVSLDIEITFELGFEDDIYRQAKNSFRIRLAQDQLW